MPQPHVLPHITTKQGGKEKGQAQHNNQQQTDKVFHITDTNKHMQQTDEPQGLKN